jgi:tRNA(Ile)-lysidine synthase
MAWTLLHARLHRSLKQRQLLPTGRSLLVAVSGGQDSLCLAQLLLDLQPKWNWQLAIAHCDHRWRDDSQANAAYVHQLAQLWQLPFFLETATAEIASEATARTWRYQTLSAIAHQQNCAYVVTGHTASDRAETLLYNLIRGSGADGLQALTWTRSLTTELLTTATLTSETLTAEIQLVRPLLDITRTETAQFCASANLQPWEDATNQDLKCARNRIRQELLPYLKTHFNPQAESALAQTAELLQADVDYLETTAAELLTRSRHLDRLGLDRQLLQAAPLALQRRAIRQFLQSTLPEAPSFDHIEKLLALINAPNRSQTDPFPGGAIAQVEHNWIWLNQEQPSV